MSLRRRRPDEWSTKHARARVALSDRLDGVIDPGEAAWLEGHLAACPECRTAADDYAAQRLQLRSAATHAPTPPRDLWARTAAAIEHESRFRDHRAAGGRTRRSLLTRSPALVAALVVTVVVGTLISSRLSIDVSHATPSPTVVTAAGTPATATSQPQATRIPVPGQHIQWISKGQDGHY